jgi:hypothetical protein
MGQRPTLTGLLHSDREQRIHSLDQRLQQDVAVMSRFIAWLSACNRLRL